MITLFFIKKTELSFRKKLVFSRSSPDGNEKPGMETTSFSCSKKATERSSFWSKKNSFINEDLPCTAGLAPNYF